MKSVFCSWSEVCYINIFLLCNWKFGSMLIMKVLYTCRDMCDIYRCDSG